MDTEVLALVTVGILLFLMNALSQLIIVCEPNEVVVLSGYGGRDPSTGERTGYRVLRAGWRLRWPFFERADRLDMRLMPIDITVENAYSEGSIPLTIRAIANVKLASDEKLIGNAMERFLGMPRSEIEQVARQTLEGNLRSVLATMTPEEVNQDRLTFSQKTQEEVGEDLSKLGLVVDTLKIQNVSDSVDYLASISRAAVARVQREASVAASDAEQAIGSAVAQAQAAINVAEQTAEEAIRRKTNELEAVKAELDGQVASEIERTEAAGRQAKAQAEKQLQEIRANLAKLRLQTEVVLPAQAQEEAARLRAEGSSALIAERGAATADAFRLLTESWSKGGDAAREVFLIQKFDDVLKGIVASVKQVQADSVTLVDTEGGQALSGYLASYPAMVRGVLGEFQETLGVDFQGALTGTETISIPTPQASQSPPLKTAKGEATASELFELVAQEVSRVGKLGEKQQRFLTQVAHLLGLSTEQAATILTATEKTEGTAPPGTPSSTSLYGHAVALALRDGVLSARERKLLTSLATALGLKPDIRTQIEVAAGLPAVTPTPEAD
jgi:flotillin